MKQKGFTLIELLVVMGIMAILAAVVIVALNPGRIFARARDTQRWSNVNTILNAVGQRMIDNKGLWSSNCGTATTTITATSTHIGSDVGLANLEPCLVPIYLSQMVLDPSSGTTANTGYQIYQSATTSRITVTAPGAELEEIISVTR